MLLKRIATFLPAELAAIIPDLETAGIRTTENVLFTPLNTLADLLPAHKELLEQLQEECLDITSPEETTGEDSVLALEAARAERTGWAGFGCPSLDELFGEWEGYGIVEVAGPSRVGKSVSPLNPLLSSERIEQHAARADDHQLLVLHAVLRQLLHDPQAICRWLDSDGTFSPTRAQAILKAWGVKNPKDVLDRLTVTPCFRVEPDLYNALGAIQSELAEEAGPSTSNKPITRMLVIDPINHLFKDMLLSTNGAQGHAGMVTVLEEIAELTHSHSLTTLICNAASSSAGGNKSSSFSTTTHKPALGTAFSYLADVTLLVQETGRIFGLADEEERGRARRQPGLRGVVEVVKSRVSATGGWAVFETDGVGLQSVVAPPLDDERTIRMSAGLPTGPVRPIHGPLARTVIP